jgi:hypothetical protein
MKNVIQPGIFLDIKGELVMLLGGSLEGNTIRISIMQHSPLSLRLVRRTYLRFPQELILKAAKV